RSSSDWLLFTDADCVFHPDSLRRAIHYATKTATDHLVLFPTAHMKTLGESMMISFPQVMSSFAMRPWKVRHPKARDYIGVCALAYFECVCPFLRIFLVHGWAKAAFAAAVVLTALVYKRSGRFMGTSPLLSLASPLASLVFEIAALQSASVALSAGAITCRG